jgi:O-antigen/teichoic acid export membrane protein
MTASLSSRWTSALRLELRKIRSSTLARNAGWMVFGQGSGFLLQSAYFILIARLLGPSEYGVYAGAFALTSILGQYSSIGSGTIFLRYVTADPEKFSLYWGNILMVTMIASVAVIAGLSIFAGRLLSPGTQSITLLAAVANCFCNQLTTSAAKVFQTYEQLQVTAVLNVATNLARTLAAAAMLLGIHHASAYQWSVATVIVSLLAASAAIVTVTVKFGWPAFSLDLARRHFAEGFGFAFATSTSTAYNDVDKTMLSHYGMNAANGIYSMAYRIIDVATIPGLAIREAALPRFFQSGQSGIRASAALAMRLLKRAAPLGLIAAAAVFVSAPLVPHLVGNGFRETVLALRWLCLIPVLRAFHHMTGSALTGSGLQRYRTLSQIAAVGLNVGLNVWLIPRHGWLGAAWSSLATDGMLAVMNCGTLAWACRLAVPEPIPVSV